MVKKFFRNFRFNNFAGKIELNCNVQNLKSQISQIFIDQIDFFYKIDWFSLMLLYMWVEDELIWMSFSAQNQKNWFSEIFAFVNPIIILKVSAKIE